MFRLGSMLLSTFCLLAVTGCGASPDSLYKQAIDDTNKLADAIESDKPEADRKKIEARLKEVGGKIDKLSDDEKKRLGVKYGDDIAKANARWMTASLKKGLGDVQGMMKGLFKGMEEGAIKGLTEGLQEGAPPPGF